MWLTITDTRVKKSFNANSIYITNIWPYKYAFYVYSFGNPCVCAKFSDNRTQNS